MDQPRLTIDLDAIGRNLEILRNAASHSDVAGVVKADAYGLGQEPVVKKLSASGVTTFFVAQMSEGIRLRECLPKAIIYVLNGASEAALRDCVEANLLPVINSLGQLETWSKRCPGKHTAVHFDTGMCRLGLDNNELMALDKRPELLQAVDAPLLMTHFVSAEVSGDPVTGKQWDRFRRICERFPHGSKSLANSAGCFLDKAFHGDIVRPGVAMYGGNPTDRSENPMVDPIKLEAPILQVRTIEAGDDVGYNGTWTAKRTTRVATIPIGYADGFLRSHSDRGDVYINGIAAPIIGRVSMDLVTIDVTDVTPFPREGTLVEIFGPNRPIAEAAKDAGTIVYEMLTSLGARYQRHYGGAA